MGYASIIVDIDHTIIAAIEKQTHQQIISVYFLRLSEDCAWGILQNLEIGGVKLRVNRNY